MRSTRPFEGRFIEALHVRPARPGAASNYGLAVSHDRGHIAVSHDSGDVTVYALSDAGTWEQKCSFGSHLWGFTGNLDNSCVLHTPRKMRFTRGGNLLVAEHGRRCVQEVTVKGTSVRYIGLAVIQHRIHGLDATDDLIAVSQWEDIGDDRIMVFDAHTGAFVRAFGAYGMGPGQLGKYCQSVRITPDGKHIVAVNGERPQYKLSVFTVDGVFVRDIGSDRLRFGSDMECAENGDLIVSEIEPHRLSVFSLHTGDVIFSIGSERGTKDGEFNNPCGLARVGNILYVADWNSDRIQVFQ